MNTTSDRPDNPAGPAHRGEQTGKREAEERNDPEVQPGARVGRQEPAYVHPEPQRGPGEE